MFIRLLSLDDFINSSDIFNKRRKKWLMNIWNDLMNAKLATRTVEIDQDRLAVKNCHVQKSQEILGATLGRTSHLMLFTTLLTQYKIGVHPSIVTHCKKNVLISVHFYSYRITKGCIIEKKRTRGRIRNFLYNKLCHRVTFIFQLFFCAFGWAILLERLRDAIF